MAMNESLSLADPALQGGPAIANEPAHWATLNTANATEAQLKQEMHDHYSTLTASGAKTNWLNRIRNKANNVEKLDAFMDVLNNP